MDVCSWSQVHLKKHPLPLRQAALRGLLIATADWYNRGYYHLATVSVGEG